MGSDERDRVRDRSTGDDGDSGAESPTTLATPLLVGTDAVEYDPDAGSFTVAFDHETDPPSSVIVHGVAAIEDQEPVDLQPLYRRLDPDALDRLYASLAGSDRTGAARLQFTFDDYEITLHDTGTVEILPRDKAKPVQPC